MRASSFNSKETQASIGFHDCDPRFGIGGSLFDENVAEIKWCVIVRKSLEFDYR
jgi:hypothetical protein